MNWKFKLVAVVMLILIIFLYINIADFNPVKKDDTFIETANFGNGFEMDVKCCGTQEGPAWTEAVLFKNGSEVCCSEPDEDFFGDWTLECDEDTFITHVIASGEDETPKNTERPLVAMATPPVPHDDINPEPLSAPAVVPETNTPEPKQVATPVTQVPVVPKAQPANQIEPANYKTNTKVTYLYRDGGNYKIFLEEVFRGKLPEDQMKAFNYKYAEQGFYPSKLQMNDMMTVGSKDGNDPDYHEFTRLILVQEPATVNKHINDFVKAFEEKKCLAF
jgi:hypothetical protein